MTAAGGTTRPPVAATALPLAAVVAAIVSVQFGASFAKRLFPLVGAEGTVALRLGLASIMLAGVLRPWRVRPSAAAWRVLIAYGIVLGTMNFAFYLSLRTVPLGIAVALEFVGPLAVATFGARRPLDFVWIALAVGGMAWLLPIAGTSAVDPVGALLALAAGVCWGMYIVFGQRAGCQIGAPAAAIGSIVATLLVFPIGVAHAGAALFAPQVLTLALVVALFSSALPYSLEMFALGRLPREAFGLLMSAEPAVGALMGLAFLGETLSSTQTAAIAAIILASVGTTLTIRPAAVEPAA